MKEAQMSPLLRQTTLPSTLQPRSLSLAVPQLAAGFLVELRRRTNGQRKPSTLQRPRDLGLPTHLLSMESI